MTGRRGLTRRSILKSAKAAKPRTQRSPLFTRLQPFLAPPPLWAIMPIASVALLTILTVSLITEEATPTSDSPHALSAATKQQATHAASAFTPQLAAELERTIATANALLEEDDPSTDDLHTLATHLSDWNARVERELDVIAQRIATGEEDPAAVRAYLNARIRELASRVELEPVLGIAPGTSYGRILGAPHLYLPPAQAEEQIAALIAKFIEKIQNANNPAQKAAFIQVLEQLREMGKLFDTTPPEFIASMPNDGAQLSELELFFSMDVTDALSLLDLSSAALSETSQDLELTPYLTLVSFDAVSNTATFSATIPTSLFLPGLRVLAATISDLAGNLAVLSINIEILTLDNSPPAVVITSPSLDNVQATQSIQVSGEVSDSLSAIDLSSFVAHLNGSDVTAILVLETMSPRILSFSGTLSAQFGSNLLEINVADVAGNVTADGFEFELVNGPPTGSELPPISLVAISPPAQEVLVGRSVPGDILVGVMQGESSLESMPVNFELIEGAGELVSPFQSVSWSSDSAGVAGTGFVPALGENALQAKLAGPPGVSPIIFQITGKNPTAELLAAQVLFPSSYEEFPGNALPLPIIIRVKDHMNQVLSGVQVRPVVVNEAGEPLEDFSDIGQFVPGTSMTNEEGIAEFGFVIKTDSPGPLQLKGLLTDYRDSNNKPIATPVLTANVLDPALKILNVQIQTPQGMVTLPNTTMPDNITLSINVPSDTSGSLLFVVNYGDGSLLPGQGAFQEGLQVGVDVRTASVIFGPGPSVVSVGYKKGPLNIPAIIVVRVGSVVIEEPVGPVLDAYVVAPTEVRLVRRSYQKNSDGSLVRDSDGDPVPVQGVQFEPIEPPRNYLAQSPIFDSAGAFKSAEPEFEVYVEGLLPKNLSSSVGLVRARRHDSIVPEFSESQFLPAQRQVQMTDGGLEPSGRARIHRSSPIVCVSPINLTTVDPPSETATPSGQLLIHCPDQTFLESFMIGPLIQPVKPARIAPTSVYLFGIDALGSDIFLAQKDHFKGLFGAESIEETDHPKVMNYKDSSGNITGVVISPIQSTFPSITLTSLASLLASKDPKATGMLQELFLRDELIKLDYLISFTGEGGPKSVTRHRRHFAPVGGANPRTADTGNMVFGRLANKMSILHDLTVGGGFLLTTMQHRKGGWATYMFPYWPMADGSIAQGLQGSMGFGGEYHRFPTSVSGLSALDTLSLIGYVRKSTKNLAQTIDQLTEQTIRDRLASDLPPHVHQLIWFTGYDRLAHDAAESDQDLKDFLATIPTRITTILGDLDDAERERTYFCVFSDHGLIKVGAEAKNAITLKEVQEALPEYDIFHQPGNDTDRSNVVLGEESENQDEFSTSSSPTLVVTFQDGLAHLFLRKEEWKNTPEFSEVLQLAERIRLKAFFEGDAAIRDTLAAILVRDPKGMAASFENKYFVYPGNLTLEDPTQNPTLTLKQWFDAHPDLEGNYVDSLQDLLDEMPSKRTGDVILLPLVHKTDPTKRYYFFHEQQYGHGGPTKEEMEVPFLIGYAGKAKAFRDVVAEKPAATIKSFPDEGKKRVDIWRLDKFVLEDLLDIKRD